MPADRTTDQQSIRNRHRQRQVRRIFGTGCRGDPVSTIFWSSMARPPLFPSPAIWSGVFLVAAHYGVARLPLQCSELSSAILRRVGRYLRGYGELGYDTVGVESSCRPGFSADPPNCIVCCGRFTPTGSHRVREVFLIVYSNRKSVCVSSFSIVRSLPCTTTSIAIMPRRMMRTKMTTSIC